MAGIWNGRVNGMTTATTGPHPMTAGQEWRSFWPLVLSALAGLSFGAIPSATLGLFMDPLQQEFGWSRTEISAGMTIFAAVSLPLTPLAGILVDRIGARRAAIPGLLGTGLMFAAFGLMTGPVWQWVVGWIVLTMFASLIRSMVWNTAISKTFSVSRGFAMAVLLSGLGMASAIAPIMTNWLVSHAGWRNAYAGIGLGWGGLALLLVIFMFHDRPRAVSAAGPAGQSHPREIPGGLTLKQAFRNPIMYRIAFAMFLTTLAGAAAMVHMVPMLTGMGLSRGQAASYAGLLGLASVVGKLGSGWLIDRVTGSILPVFAFGGPAIGFLLLLYGNGAGWSITAAILLMGICSGASLQLSTYLTSRYAGVRYFGSIFGIISALMGLAAGVGPLVGGAIFDVTGGYAGLLLASVPAGMIAGLCVAGLGAYPIFEPVRVEPTPAGDPIPAMV